jgi:hypothetical protein
VPYKAQTPTKTWPSSLQISEADMHLLLANHNADVNLEINKKGKKTIYTPRLIFAVPEKECINIYGTVELGKTKGKIVRFAL